MLEKKMNAGAQFFQTQTIFDIAQYRAFHEQVKHLPVKILPGVALLKSLAFVDFMKALPGVHIPDNVVQRMATAKDQLQEGIQICAETIEQLKEFADGVHVMAIGMEEHIPEILRRVR